MRSEDFGVAPVWRDTGDVAYTIPAGFRAIGVYCGGAGNIVFTSAGVEVTMPINAGMWLPGNITAISGSSTATDIFVALVKG